MRLLISLLMVAGVHAIITIALVVLYGLFIFLGF
jgi:hypothetical protein